MEAGIENTWSARTEAELDYLYHIEQVTGNIIL